MNMIANNISVILNGNHILKGITSKVHKGEFVGLIGPNGSGKSTLLKTIYRAIKPKAGWITLDEKKIFDIPLKETAKQMAVVRQFNNFNFDFSVEEIVMMGRAPHKKMLELDNVKDYEIVYEALKKVDMQDYAKRSFSTLSGGEKQRIMVARALAQKAKFLILDEPTNHLDIKYQLQLLDLIKSLGLEVFAALHDLNLAAMYCNRIYVIKEGKIVAEGKPKEVITEKLLKEVFEVNAEIRQHSLTGQLNIIYLPKHYENILKQN
ncbi:ABC transporter ATP-binding protein [Paramaledivibacter caminithermalis]|jgi:iron complex transport system ATP-binding protein|uniref:Iron complex transport system ATP-binding protein n=1 Tax=Paramaledivibacter caminithermalis (strain DSM 15212 / CIP 107654 / DViRD3) TaxID=1121301 RepID=A0A1M6P395_PARC5|nr:ABC transporter ATP-binding protein [Paramaledivibacter caminithermalis]SHK02373.1 iron complex transport system ATP-binding protein [Paramaledivibacter caminithermalis DSM 15212]